MARCRAMLFRGQVNSVYQISMAYLVSSGTYLPWTYALSHENQLSCLLPLLE